MVEVLLQKMDKPIQSDQATAIQITGLTLQIVQPEVAIVEVAIVMVIIAQLRLVDPIRQVPEVVHLDPVVDLQVQEAAQAGGKCLITM